MPANSPTIRQQPIKKKEKKLVLHKSKSKNKKDHNKRNQNNPKKWMILKRAIKEESFQVQLPKD